MSTATATYVPGKPGGQYARELFADDQPLQEAHSRLNEARAATGAAQRTFDEATRTAASKEQQARELAVKVELGEAKQQDVDRLRKEAKEAREQATEAGATIEVKQRAQQVLEERLRKTRDEARGRKQAEYSQQYRAVFQELFDAFTAFEAARDKAENFEKLMVASTLHVPHKHKHQASALDRIQATPGGTSLERWFRDVAKEYGYTL